MNTKVESMINRVVNGKDPHRVLSEVDSATATDNMVFRRSMAMELEQVAKDTEKEARNPQFANDKEAISTLLKDAKDYRKLASAITSGASANKAISMIRSMDTAAIDDIPMSVLDWSEFNW